MRMGRNCMLSGHEIELIGSETSLSELTELDGVRSLMRRGTLLPLEVEETFLDPGMVGAAYVRDRACEKRTEGWLRRNKARAQRRGKPWNEINAPAQRNDRNALRLSYGKVVLHVRQIMGEMTVDNLMVSTYGFSSPVSSHQAILPVYPDIAREADDAA